MKTTRVTTDKLQPGDVFNLFGVDGDVRDIVVAVSVKPTVGYPNQTTVEYRYLGEEKVWPGYWLSKTTYRVILSIRELL